MNKKNIEVFYPVTYQTQKSIGVFADELSFKHKLMSSILKDKRFKKVFAIENSVEPGMPDLLVIEQDDRVFFIETKYAKNGVITFKKSQPSWYMRHSDLNIFISAYDDRTTDIHIVCAKQILAEMKGKTFKLWKDMQIEVEALESPATK